MPGRTPYSVSRRRFIGGTFARRCPAVHTHASAAVTTVAAVVGSVSVSGIDVSGRPRPPSSRRWSMRLPGRC